MIQGMLDALVVLLAASVAAVVLLRALGLPSAVAYLMVGLMVGPHGFDWIAHTDGVHRLGELGIVFLLFTLGLEFTLGEMRKAGAVVLSLGLAQIGTTVFAVAVLAGVLGVPWAAGLVLGVGLAMSSTAVVVKELQALEALGTAEGRLSTGVLLVQDLVVVPALVLVPLLGAVGGLSVEAVSWGVLRGAAVLIAMPLAGFLLLRTVFCRLAGRSSPELFTLLTLLFVLGAAWISEQAGLSTGLGAFLAGLVLGETEFRHQVEADIRPFRDVLLGFFFLVIGMMVDTGYVFEHLTSVAALAVLLMLGKAGLIAVIALLTRVPLRTSLRTALILAQGGEFGFAVLILAAEERVLSADSAQRGLAVIALSLLAAPLLIRWSGRLSGRLAAAPLEDREGVDYSAGMDEPDGRHVLLVGEAGTLVRLGERLESHGYPWRGISGNAAEVHRLAGADGRLLFGDPGRRELLHAAGIRRAEALVVLAGEAGHPARVVRQARLLAPGLSIVGFAKSAAQGQTLLDAGANDVALEIDALDAVHELRLLRFLGLPAEAVAGRVAEVCRSLNEATPVSAVSTARHAESKVTPR